MADRLDSLAGLFAAGIRPRSTADPYGLRRDAIGLLSCLIAKDQPFSLRQGLKKAATHLPIKADAEKIDEAYDFILRRLEIQLRDEGFRPDVVSAAIEGGSDDPAEIKKTVEQLDAAVAHILSLCEAEVYPEIHAACIHVRDRAAGQALGQRFIAHRREALDRSVRGQLDQLDLRDLRL